MQDNAKDGGFNFEEAMKEIEIIVRDIEEGKLGLDESIKKYERGCQLIRKCQAFLEQKNQQLEEISTREATQDRQPNDGKSNSPKETDPF